MSWRRNMWFNQRVAILAPLRDTFQLEYRIVWNAEAKKQIRERGETGGRVSVGTGTCGGWLRSMTGHQVVCHTGSQSTRICFLSLLFNLVFFFFGGGGQGEISKAEVFTWSRLVSVLQFKWVFFFDLLESSEEYPTLPEKEHGSWTWYPWKRLEKGRLECFYWNLGIASTWLCLIIVKFTIIIFIYISIDIHVIHLFLHRFKYKYLCIHLGIDIHS